MASKLDKIAADIGQIKITQAEQHIVLKDHIKRTELLELEVLPMKKHLHYWAFSGKLMAWGGGVIAATAAIVEIVKYLQHV